MKLVIYRRLAPIEWYMDLDIVTGDKVILEYLRNAGNIFIWKETGTGFFILYPFLMFMGSSLSLSLSLSTGSGIKMKCMSRGEVSFKVFGCHRIGCYLFASPGIDIPLLLFLLLL